MKLVPRLPKSWSFLLFSFSLISLLTISCQEKSSPKELVQINTRIESSVPQGKNIATITGTGEYVQGERVTIQAGVTPNSGYVLVALYEENGRGGYTKEQGLVNETSLVNGYKKVKDVLCSISLIANEDMTFIALIEPINDNTHKENHIEIGDVGVQELVLATDTLHVSTIESN